MRETKPLRLFTMLSAGYGEFVVGFREVRTDRTSLYIADLGWGPTEPNKTNLANAIVINNVTEKSWVQTQRTYPIHYQTIASTVTPILREFGWKRRASPSGIRAHGQRRSRRRLQENLCPRRVLSPSDSSVDRQRLVRPHLTIRGGVFKLGQLWKLESSLCPPRRSPSITPKSSGSNRKETNREDKGPAVF